MCLVLHRAILSSCREHSSALTSQLDAFHVASDSQAPGGSVRNKASLSNRWELIRFSLLMVWSTSVPLCICSCVCVCLSVLFLCRKIWGCHTVHEGLGVDVMLSAWGEWRTGPVLLWNADLKCRVYLSVGSAWRQCGLVWIRVKVQRLGAPPRHTLGPPYRA